MHYQIIRQKLFDEQLKNITQSYSRMKELDEAIDWALSRFDAELMADDIVLLSKEGYYLWVLPHYPSSSLPKVRMTFFVNEKNKKITLIEISEPF